MYTLNFIIVQFPLLILSQFIADIGIRVIKRANILGGFGLGGIKGDGGKDRVVAGGAAAMTPS